MALSFSSRVFRQRLVANQPISLCKASTPKMFYSISTERFVRMNRFGQRWLAIRTVCYYSHSTVPGRSREERTKAHENNKSSIFRYCTY
ncbi:unnamed protein product [Toxocara canis]|uniref:Uncharacterized protein n=1 Tax=Toxocara canis TaxID=6265 RepID=A0A183U9N7_TOXCA|nr:unnamed protein product [Toxocara canis]